MYIDNLPFCRPKNQAPPHGHSVLLLFPENACIIFFVYASAAYPRSICMGGKDLVTAVIALKELPLAWEEAVSAVKLPRGGGMASN